MELIQEYAAQLIQLYAAVEPYLRALHRSLAALRLQVEPVLLPHINALARWAYASPSILIVGLFILLTLLLLQTINLIRRILAFWIRLLVRLTFWAAVAALISVVWQRGVGRTLRELEDWGREVAAVYWREYKRWENYGSNPMKGGQGGNYGARKTGSNPQPSWW